ncbi:hypothetical protein SAMN04487972_103160 [Paracoccus halophilus]|uniref:Uncharacterized protein n=1 Tax=Paracoccus halophilus TaxID=376733 RepID=A0A1I0SX24_9RHOB|nr:hypothetical protein [Paracoccus halophilus]SFA44078.1 hypothetical protein SAMN04487972_103160 [Paracoccus halophilus]
MSDDTSLPDHDDHPPVTGGRTDEHGGARYRARPDFAGDSRRIPPHGDVSPDGSRTWPRPSAQAKWLVWGGTALAVAALTAGTVIAGRHLLAALSDESPPPRARRAMAPRFADLADEEREAIRQRARARELDDDRRAARLRAEAMRKRRAGRRSGGPGLLQEVETNTASLSNGVDNLMGALASALLGFREVAAQAGSIVRDFGDTADLIRDLADGANRRAVPPGTARTDPAGDTAEPETRDDARLHRL